MEERTLSLSLLGEVGASFTPIVETGGNSEKMLRGRLSLREAFVSFALLLGLAGCASGPAVVGRSSLQVVSSGVLPTPGSANPASSEFVLVPLDRLRIDVLGMDDLSGRVVQVDGGGNIAFPYAGVIPAAGRTPEAIAQQIHDALKAHYIRYPQVTVNVDQAAPRTYTVYGEVREPGNYPALGSTTLMRAVAGAHGLGEFARDREVILFRSVGGHDYAAVYNLRAISSGAYADPAIFPGDVIAVGDSAARRRYKDILNLTPLLLNPLVLLLR